MSFGNTTSSDDALLKNLYSDERITKSLFMKNKLLAMVPKKEDAVGRLHASLVAYGAGQSRSATFATAQAMAALTGEQTVQFQVTLAENHADATVQSRLIAETRGGGKGAFLEAVALIADNQLINFGNDVARSLYRTSDGNIGQISSSTTLGSSSLYLSNIKDTLNFEVGMQLDVAQTKTGAKRAYGSGSHGLYVVAVDYENGFISVGQTPTQGGTLCNITDSTYGVPDASAGDYLFITGDQNLKMNGAQDWIPYGGVASDDSFNNVNRFANPVRLAGNWVDGTAGQSLIATLEDAINQVGEVGGDLTHFMMNFKQYGNLNKEFTGKVQLVDVPVDEDIGFEGIEINGSTGSVVCLPDRTCPSTMVLGADIDTWELLSVGKAVHVWDEDGKVWLRSPTDSGMEIRFYSLCNLLCKDPRSNINIKVNP